MFCPNCGNQISENEKFCSKCGFTVNPGAQQSAPQNTYTPEKDESDRTDSFDSIDIERTRYLSAVCYLGVLFMILALVIEPDSKFIRYHINQALLISIFGIACAVVCIIPFLGWIIGGIGSIAAFVFTIMGIVRAFKGVAVDLPFIGKYTIIHYN